MSAALKPHPGAVVLIGSAPTDLELLLDRVAQGDPAPVLVIAMPVGFVSVTGIKRRVAASSCRIPVKADPETQACQQQPLMTD